jgi:phosphate transport system substrate-binding protein
VETSEDVERYVAGSNRAIGYLGLNLASDDDLGIVAYEGTVPSAETVRDGSYPLARTLYMYTWGEPDEDERAYLEFVTGEKGQAIAESVGFVPIST